MAPAIPPSDQCDCDDQSTCSCSEPEPVQVQTPAKEKPNTNNTPSPGKRKVSNTPNGPRTPATARRVPSAAKHTTPIRKPSAPNAKPPNSAPAGAKAGGKRPEPTLLGDFLLGRPSPARQRAARRKSLDVVKAEMRECNVRGFQAPGKVQERVRQWQKNGAAIAIDDPNIEDIAVSVKSESNDGQDEADRLRVKNRGKRKSKSPIPDERPERRKIQGGKDSHANGHKDGDERQRSKTVAPKKRVISDSHWMKNKKSPPRKTSGIPKNFLQATAANPPVERKIEDWVKRTTETLAVPEKLETPKRKPRNLNPDHTGELSSRKGSRQRSPHDDDDGIRIRASRPTSIRKRPSRERPEDDSSWVTSSRGGSNDDGIRIKPSKPANDGVKVKSWKVDSQEDGIRIKPSNQESQGDGIRIRPSRETSVHEEVQVKQVRKDGSKRRSKEEKDTPTPTPRRSEKHLKPPTEFDSKSRATSYATTQEEEDDRFSWTTPSPPGKSKRKNRKSDTMTATESLDEIPFGNSAFSVLDLPLGAEAGTLNRSTPKRNQSFGVPKVLKRVYNEGMKIVHDNHEPERGGPNQPPSIDSWLNGTSDPFLDGAPEATASLPLPVATSHPSRMPSYKEDSKKEDDKTERDRNGEHGGNRSGSQRKPQKPKSLERDDVLEDLYPARNREALPSMDKPLPMSPGGLKRTPATHKTASPKSGMKLFSKEAIFDAFKGESAMAGQKDSEPSPFDFIGLRERDLNRAPLEVHTTPMKDYESIPKEPQRKASSSSTRKSTFIEPSLKNLPPFPRRVPPTTGDGIRSSTIASVETSSASSSITTTESELSQTTISDLSQTTITQDTVLTDPTSSSLSRTSLSRSSVKPRRKGSKAKKLERSDTGSKRGLTKHSDLLSVLSLPDTSQPGRADSIRPARSMRTMRTHLETATVEDLMREIAEDEAKYMRELNTLVDGVIPVLLTCVLSKNDAAIAAGLFNPIASATDKISFTKPIIDMGIALERLKSLHNRIPLADIDAFLFWAQSAQKTYQDYLVAWRTGFQDVVVNLEPASPSSTPQKVDTEMKRDKNGDVIRDNGERADVAYLLKRPLVRVKYLARATKGFDKLKQTSLSNKIMVVWEQLETFGRRRVREEAARREDLDAAMVDPTRARDPKTMAPIEGVKIDPSLQVSGKDTFSLDLQHSSGQRMVCQVELILRDLPSEPNYGDILICGFDNTHRYLLFPPINKSLASARYGVNDTELVIMIRSDDDQDPWQELLVLGAEDLEASKYWVDELGTIPLVSALPTVQITDLVPRSLTMSTILEEPASLVSLPTVNDIPVQDDVPIGERRGREEDVARTPSPPVPKRLPSYRRRGPVASAYERLKDEKLSEITEMNVIDFKELNDAMAKAGLPPVKKLKPIGVNPTKRPTPSRYHKRKDESANGEPSVVDITGDATFIVEMSGALDPYPGEMIEPESQEIIEPKSQEIIETEGQDVQVTELTDYRAGSPDYSQFPMDLPYIPKKRASSSSSIPEQPKTPLKESMQPDFQCPSKRQPNTSTYEEGPPPVPAHRTPSTPETLKKIPILDTPTPRNKNRLVSSPLKHEYQPSESDASGTSSCDDSDYSTSSSSSYSDSSDDELEAIEEEDEARPPLPMITPSAKRMSPNGSIYSLANDSLAPSNSASQGPYTARVPSNGTIIDPLTADVRKFVATVSLWNGAKGRWEDIFSRPDQTCSIVVSAGLIEAFEIDSDHASPSRNLNKNDKKEGPLIALGLTPHVPLRQSTVIDIEVTSPPLISSRVKKSPTIRFRALTSPECKAMYEAIHRARMNNPAWKKLEQDRMLAAYGNGNCAYEAAVAPSRRTWFGRKRSYRASARAPSEIASEQSSQSSPSAFSALKRMGGGGLFNIAKSSVHTARGGGSNPSSGPTSMYTTGSSEYSGVTTPKSLSIAASGSMYSNGLAVRNIGSDNLKIRLYRGATSSKWQDMGEARLTVSNPPSGMRHASSLDHGVLKRITVIKAQSEDDEPIEQNEHGRTSKRDKEVVVWLDIVLGSRNFLKYGRNGIAFEIWEDIRGDDGVVGVVPKQGGVSGTSRKWMFQTRRAGDCVWILGLVGGYEV